MPRMQLVDLAQLGIACTHMACHVARLGGLGGRGGGGSVQERTKLDQRLLESSRGSQPHAVQPGHPRRTELVHARRGCGALALKQQRLRLLLVLMRAQRGGMQRPELALDEPGEPVGDLHAAELEQRVHEHVQGALDITQTRLHVAQLTLLQIESSRRGCAHAVACTARGQVDKPKLRVPCDRGGLTCREGGRKEARAQPCKPVDAHALIVGEEEARRIRRRRKSEGAVACVGHLPLQLLKGVQQQA